MEVLTETDIRASMCNCSQSERRRIWVPNVASIPWNDLEYLGWRDPKAEQRGALVCSTDKGPLGIVVRAPGGPVRRAAQCALCHSVHEDNVALFAARRGGEAGRNANTIGTYICADLACSSHLRAAAKPTRAVPDPAPQLAVRCSQLQNRLELFIAKVLER